MSINRSETLDSKLMIKQRYRSKKALHVYRVCIYIYIYIYCCSGEMQAPRDTA